MNRLKPLRPITVGIALAGERKPSKGLQIPISRSAAACRRNCPGNGTGPRICPALPMRRCALNNALSRRDTRPACRRNCPDIGTPPGICPLLPKPQTPLKHALSAATRGFFRTGLGSRSQTSGDSEFSRQGLRQCGRRVIRTYIGDCRSCMWYGISDTALLHVPSAGHKGGPVSSHVVLRYLDTNFPIAPERA